jgi:hypothetical protein
MQDERNRPNRSNVFNVYYLDEIVKNRSRRGKRADNTTQY